MVRLVESNLWESFRRTIKTKLHEESFETWFNPIGFEGVDPTQRVLRLRAPNSVVRDWVRSNYGGVIDQSFTELNLPGYSVDWTVTEGAGKTETQNLPAIEAAAVSVPTTKSENPSPSRSVATAAAPAREVSLDPSLNSKYTFLLDTYCLLKPFYFL